MKILTCIIILLVFIPISALDILILPSSRIETKYNSNILNLSPYHLDEFKAGGRPEKYRISSADDLITSVRVELGLRHTYLGGRTQNNKFIMNYHKYWNNSIKDSGYFGYELQQFFGRKFFVTLNYFYFPEIYVNNFTSELETQTIYREFSYSRNIYRTRFRWRFHNMVHLDYKFDISNLYYNEYFTEYDANNRESDIGFIVFPNENIRMTIRYAYRISSAKGGAEAYPDLNVQKDPSYEMNNYYYSISFPFHILKRDTHFFSRLEYEERFFQSDYESNSYHFGREDRKISFYNLLRIPMTDSVQLRTNYSFEQRRTDSPFSFVERDKKYSTHEVGLGLDIDL